VKKQLDLDSDLDSSNSDGLGLGLDLKAMDSDLDLDSAVAGLVTSLTKTAKIKKVLLLKSMLTLWRRAAKVIATF